MCQTHTKVHICIYVQPRVYPGAASLEVGVNVTHGYYCAYIFVSNDFNPITITVIQKLHKCLSDIPHTHTYWSLGIIPWKMIHDYLHWNFACYVCFLRLSKELQQKDKLIESLRSKLDQQQPRSDTPASSHAPSEATDQSDRTSFVSDDHGSTNEDLELCSELDAASECSQEGAARSATGSYAYVFCLCVFRLASHPTSFHPPSVSFSDSHSHRGQASLHPSNAPSITSSHSRQSSSICPSMHCTPHRPMETQAQTGIVGRDQGDQITDYLQFIQMSLF